MSLISEALKKARQEAARQDSLRQGAPYAVGAADPPRRNPLLPALAGLGAGCLFAGILFAVAWLAGWGPFARREAAPAPQVAQAAPVAAPAPSASPSALPPAVEVREEAPAAPAAAPAAPVQPQAAAPPAEPRPEPYAPPPAPAPRIEITLPAPAPPAAATVPAEEAPPAPVAPAPAAPASPVPAPPAESGPVEGQVYTGEVPLPGGGSVKLNGIAYSQERPIAVLDGRVMGPGESIQGFTIVEIEAGRVKLQGHGATVFVAPN